MRKRDSVLFHSGFANASPTLWLAGLCVCVCVRVGLERESEKASLTDFWEKVRSPRTGSSSGCAGCGVVGRRRSRLTIKLSITNSNCNSGHLFPFLLVPVR